MIGKIIQESILGVVVGIFGFGSAIITYFLPIYSTIILYQIEYCFL